MDIPVCSLLSTRLREYLAEMLATSPDFLSLVWKWFSKWCEANNNPFSFDPKDSVSQALLETGRLLSRSARPGQNFTGI